MSAIVSIHPNLLHLPYLDKIAIGLALYHDTGKYPDFLGHAGGFEENPRAKDSQLHKIHIALYAKDWSLSTWRKRNGYNRCCDNFIIYVRHFFEDNHFCILDILTPDAHKTVNAKLATYIDMAEDFHSLSQYELGQLTAYNANNIEITETIKLTPR